MKTNPTIRGLPCFLYAELRQDCSAAFVASMCLANLASISLVNFALAPLKSKAIAAELESGRAGSDVHTM